MYVSTTAEAPATAPRSASNCARPPRPWASARCTATYCATPSRGYPCVAAWALKPAWATRVAALACHAGLASPDANGRPLRDAVIAVGPDVRSVHADTTMRMDRRTAARAVGALMNTSTIARER